MLKQRAAQKTGNGQGARVTAVPTLMHSTLGVLKKYGAGHSSVVTE
jgi:hypothetical protein